MLSLQQRQPARLRFVCEHVRFPTQIAKHEPSAYLGVGATKTKSVEEASNELRSLPIIKLDSATTIGGIVTLSIDGKSVGNATLENVVPVRFSATETLDMDLGSGVSTKYSAPFPSQGGLRMCK